MYRAAGGGITLSTETERGVGLPGLPRPRYHAFTARSHWQTSSRSRYAKVCQVCLDRARLAAADALARVVGGCGGAALLDLHSGATGVHPAAWRLLATGQVPHAVYGRPGRQQEPPWPTGPPAVPNCSPRGTGRRKRPLAAPEGMRCPVRASTTSRSPAWAASGAVPWASRHPRPPRERATTWASDRATWAAEQATWAAEQATWSAVAGFWAGVARKTLAATVKNGVIRCAVVSRHSAFCS